MSKRFQLDSLAKLALGATGLVTLIICLSRIAYPHDLGLYESDRWAPADAIANGHTPYYMSSATSPPYVVAPYGPLYYGLLAIGSRLFGDQFAFGRSLGLVALILTALFVYVIIRRYAVNSSRFIPLLGAGLVLAQYPIQAIGAVEGPDIVGLALALGGLALVFVREPTGARHGLLHAALAGVALAAAVLVRQTLFLPILVAFAWYALNRDGRRMIAFGIAAAAAGGAAFVLLQATSDGGFFWHAVRLEASFPLWFSQARRLGLTYLRSPATLFTLLLLVIGMLRTKSRGAQAADGENTAGLRLLRRLLLGYLAAAVVLAVVTSAKEGASINYWLEVSVLLSLLAPLYLAGTFEPHVKPDGGRAKRLWLSDSVCLGLITLTFAGALFTGAREIHGQVLQWRALPYVNEVIADIRKLAPPGQSVYVEYPDLAVSAGRPYLFNDVVLYQDSPLLSGIYGRVLRSKSLRVIASLATTPPPGYKAVCTVHAPPPGVYDVHLYYRTTRNPAPGSTCVAA